MGLFGNNIRKIVQEFRQINEYYSNYLSRDIKESFEELKDEYDETKEVVPEFLAFIAELKPKLSSSDAAKLDNLSKKLSNLNRSARRGVDAMRELSRSQRKITCENLREFEQYET